MAVTQKDIDDLTASFAAQLDRIEKASIAKIAKDQQGAVDLDLSGLNSIVAKASNVAQQAEDALKG